MPNNDGTGPDGKGPKGGKEKGVPKRDGSGKGQGNKRRDRRQQFDRKK